MSQTVTSTPENDRSSPAKSHCTDFLAVYAGTEVLAHRNCVYALLDPRAATRVMYVGQTRQCPVSRLDGHIGQAKRGTCPFPCSQWVRRLLGEGVLPSIAVLEIVPLDEDLSDAEQGWIHYYKRLGQARLNRLVRLRHLLERELATAGATRPFRLRAPR